MIGVVLVLAVGILLSGFFSGTETGFFRVSRVRLALDARDGSRLAQIQLWFVNNPAMFVATTLVGNNLANYITSFAVVLLTQQILRESSAAAEMTAAIVSAPFIFMYGELLPKSMFFAAPNRLMRRTGPLFVLFAALLAPVSGILGVLGLMLKRLVGASHAQIRQRLARHELSRILDEGRDAGILGSGQRQLAQAVFNVANQRVFRCAVSLDRTVTVRDSDSARAVIDVAQRRQSPEVVVLRTRTKHVLGYVRACDVLLGNGDWREATRSMMAIRQDESLLTALIKLRAADATIAEVVDAQGRTVGILHIDDLLDPLVPKW